ALRDGQGVLAAADAGRRDAQGRERDGQGDRADRRRDEIGAGYIVATSARSMTERISDSESAGTSNLTKSPSGVRAITRHPPLLVSTASVWTDRCRSAITEFTRRSTRRRSTSPIGGGVPLAGGAPVAISVECPQS